MVYKFSDNKPVLGASVNEELVQELQKPVIKKFKRRKVYARLEDSVWTAGLAEIGSLSSKNGSAEYLLCVIDIFTKYYIIG